MQTLHVGATVAKVHGYAKTQNQNRASVIASPHHRASIETPYARTPSLSLILSLSLPRVHLARFQNITKKKRTNLLPILPSVHLHRLTKQLILHAANERLSVTPQHSRTNHASRNQSITRSLDRSTRARHPPPQSSRSRLLRAVSRDTSKFQTAHLLGRPSTLGALPRRSPDLPVRERARGRRRRRPIYGRRVRSRARAGVSPALPVVPPRPRLFVAVAPFSSPPSLSAFATSRARTRDDTGRREDVRRPPRAMMTRALVARRPVARRPVETMCRLSTGRRVDECRRAGGTDSRVVIRGRVGGHRHPRRHRRQRRAL